MAVFWSRFQISNEHIFDFAKLWSGFGELISVRNSEMSGMEEPPREPTQTVGNLPGRLVSSREAV